PTGPLAPPSSRSQILCRFSRHVAGLKPFTPSRGIVARGPNGPGRISQGTFRWAAGGPLGLPSGLARGLRGPASVFQIGTIRLTSSIAQAHAANASDRWAAAPARPTAPPPTGTPPPRWPPELSS